jgi:hypothetical protein
MNNRVIFNTIPERSMRGPKTIERAVLEGLKNQTGCTVGVFENPDSFEIAVEVKCARGSWSREFSPRVSLEEMEPATIRRALEGASFTDTSSAARCKTN